ncbi:nucleotidyltransferase domain-containing protein [Mesorhizobium sp. B292B1B]|uniref:nucleotidyltransferase domain-containing protein n=1 Tax=unclassified Mesorhizobium TaxID=325217 RepID=UPI00112ED57F|nr:MULTISPECIES: nucleotidyltransferase domain-containing protein [unclassified Mesorhizobium]MCA0013176.1 nucleotidyltransferase domain-containing protein [Mesorhizobium sp. B294B1A1]MCA0040166.1 nucleotidyltransferase domain-containing protein [Mesorhizobium sp. B292B1B]TPM45242.1 nucleotidyltransferase domain-containing protein [Mesorhizobium sp. B2-3-2]
MNPDSIWLFGSRAQGDNRPDIDWDILVALPDDSGPDLLDPLIGWAIQHEDRNSCDNPLRDIQRPGSELGFAKYNRV